MLYNGFMDLKELLDFFKTNVKKIIGFFISGLLFGGIVFGILPKKYISGGILFIGKEVEKSEEFYAYSGYYDQQTALSFTKTIKGFLEDKNLYAEVLTDLGENVTEKNLRKLRRKIKATDAGPQLINLEVRANSPIETEKIWEALAEITAETTKELNKNADSGIFLQTTNSEIWTREIVRNPFVFGLVGGLLLMGAEIFYLAIREYLKKEL
jgi:capsular polysaccharide biosynthesis protein